MERKKVELGTAAGLLAALFPAWTAAEDERPAIRCKKCGERHDEDDREFCGEAQFEKRGRDE